MSPYFISVYLVSRSVFPEWVAEYENLKIRYISYFSFFFWLNKLIHSYHSQVLDNQPPDDCDNWEFM